MAGLAEKNHTLFHRVGNIRIPASSIIEVTVGMVIIGIVFAIALMIYTQLSGSSKNLQQLKYSGKMKSIARETVLQGSWIDETITDEQVIIQKEVIPYGNTKGLFLLQLEALGSDNKVLASQQTIHYVDQY